MTEPTREWLLAEVERLSRLSDDVVQTAKNRLEAIHELRADLAAARERIVELEKQLEVCRSLESDMGPPLEREGGIDP